MIRSQLPELSTLLNKRVKVDVNKKRTFIGTLSGYDAFMNLVLADVVILPDIHLPSLVTIRGESIEMVVAYKD